ncbi:MAG: hypothetical protein ACE5DX_02630 [Candidatus Dojkabacteria bacterium]
MGALLTSFENEFFLLWREDRSNFSPVDKTTFSSVLALDISTDIINEISTTLLAQGITVEMYHSESGHGQQGMALTCI